MIFYLLNLNIFPSPFCSNLGVQFEMRAGRDRGFDEGSHDSQGVRPLHHPQGARPDQTIGALRSLRASLQDPGGRNRFGHHQDWDTRSKSRSIR